MKTLALLLPGLLLAALLCPVPGKTQSTGLPPNVIDSAVIQFDFGQAGLSPDAEKTLDGVFARFSQANGFVRIRITGHTDSVGTDARNLALSKRRAQVVHTALAGRKIPTSNLLIAYSGEQKPVASNATDAGRALNRRAVIELLSEPEVLSKAPDAREPVHVPILTTTPLVPYSGQVKDQSTGRGVPSVVYYEVAGKLDSVRTDAEGKYTVRLPADAPAKLQVFAPGYFFNSTTTVPSAGTAPAPVETTLAPAESGEKLALQNLHFIPDDTVLMDDSRPELSNILRFMQVNPKLRVEISGHVSIESYMPMTPELWRLAEERAKLVYDYLVANGIPARRMTHKGYGNTQMIFPEPVSAEERRQNRRVEIRVLGKD